MSFKAPDPKLCAYCGEAMLDSGRVAIGRLTFRNATFSVGWHMGEGASIESPSCYDIDEALADKILNTEATMAEGATAIETLLRDRPGRVVRSMRSSMFTGRPRPSNSKRGRKRARR